MTILPRGRCPTLQYSPPVKDSPCVVMAHDGCPTLHYSPPVKGDTAQAERVYTEPLARSSVSVERVLPLTGEEFLLQTSIIYFLFFI
jgi:hypothetical protein